MIAVSISDYSNRQPVVNPGDMETLLVARSGWNWLQITAAIGAVLTHVLRDRVQMRVDPEWEDTEGFTTPAIILDDELMLYPTPVILTQPEGKTRTTPPELVMGWVLDSITSIPPSRDDPGDTDYEALSLHATMHDAVHAAITALAGNRYNDWLEELAEQQRVEDE